MSVEERFQASKYLQFVSRMDGFALYHSLYGGLCIVDNNIKGIFDILQTSKTRLELLRITDAYGEEQIESFIKLFKSKKFLIDPEIDEYDIFKKGNSYKEKRLHMGSQICVVQLVLTNQCNFRCEYCFINHIYSSKERIKAQVSKNNRIMSCENARIYLEKIIEIIKKNGRKSLVVQFFGGEPLINWKTMRFVLEHFGNGEKFGIKIEYSVVTNGSLITDEIAEYCKNYNIPVVVSYDSTKGEGRIQANGKNSLDRVEQGLSCLNKFYNRIVFNSVLSDETFPYFETDLIDFALKFYIFEIGVLLDLNPGFYEKRKTGDIVEKLWDMYLYGKQKGVLLTGYWHMIFQLMTTYDTSRLRGFKTCAGTGCQLSIEPSGDVFACKGSSGYFGNILELEELLSSENYRKYAMRTFRNAPECDGCEIENFCSGFCLGPLEKKYGDIYVVEKNTCSVYKELTKRLIKDIEPGEVGLYKMPIIT